MNPTVVQSYVYLYFDPFPELCIPVVEGLVEVEGRAVVGPGVEAQVGKALVRNTVKEPKIESKIER